MAAAGPQPDFIVPRLYVRSADFHDGSATQVRAGGSVVADGDTSAEDYERSIERVNALQIASRGHIGELGRRVVCDVDAHRNMVLDGRVPYEKRRRLNGENAVARSVLDCETCHCHSASPVDRRDPCKLSRGTSSSIEDCSTLAVERQPVRGYRDSFPARSGDANLVAGAGRGQSLGDRLTLAAVYVPQPGLGPAWRGEDGEDQK